MSGRIPEVEKPNILYILADDLGWNDVSYHGSDIKTPNIDRLAMTGIELDQHYVCPMCTPTRASLLTGRYPGRFGTHATSPSNQPVMPDGFQTLATLLKEGGYATGLFGKWHLGSEPEYGPNQYGFDRSYGSLAGGVDPYNHHYKRGEYSNTWHRDCEPLEEQGHVTDLIVEEAVSWIAERSGPWFCYVPFTAVHVPVDAPEEWIARYADGDYDPDPARDLSFKRYAAYASHMDWGVGRLIDILKETGQLGQTIVVFASDNGARLEENTDDTDKYPGWHWRTPRLGSNYPLRGEKAQLYEGGIRTPAAISWPGHLEPGICAHPVYIADWMPTFTRLAGCQSEADPDWDGRDIWDVIQNRTVEERTIFWNFRGTDYALRKGDWKLIARNAPDPETCELYNIASDPLEEEDLASRRPEIVENLLDGIVQEQKKDGCCRRDDLD